MHKKTKSVFSMFFISLCLGCFICLQGVAAAAEPAQPLILSFHGYKITGYKINVKVQENRVLDVSEVITASFDEPKHGISRILPLQYKIRSNNGGVFSAYIQKAAVRDVSAKDGSTGEVVPVKKEKRTNQLVLQLGDGDKTFTGEKSYILHYTYQLGPEESAAFDELYYPLIGDQWDTQIGNISFDVAMPKAFDPQNLQFFVGVNEAVNFVDFSVEGNAIHGTVQDVLGNGAGLTMRLQLPKGYFKATEAEQEGFITEKAALFFFAVSFCLFLFYGVNFKTAKDWEEPITALEVGAFLGGKAGKHAVTALLLEWAEKGFVKLSCNKDGQLLLQKGISPEADGKEYEEAAWNMLFLEKDNIPPDEVKERLSAFAKKIRKDADAWLQEDENSFYTKGSCRARWVSYGCVLISLGIFSKVLLGDIYTIEDVLTIGAALAGFSALLYPFIFFLSYYWRKNGTGSRLGIVVNSSGILLCSLLFAGLLFYANVFEPYNILLAAVIGWCGFWGAVTRKRTDFGAAALKQSIDMKKALKKYKKSLPVESSGQTGLYAYAWLFGMDTIWKKAFASEMGAVPSWISSDMQGGQTGQVLFALLQELSRVIQQTTDADHSTADSCSSGGDSGGGTGGGSSW